MRGAYRGIRGELRCVEKVLNGVIISGKKYTLLDGVALLCMSVGLILFTLADSTLQPNFDQTGKLASIVSAIVIIIECHAKFITFVNICTFLYMYRVGPYQ